MPNLAFAFVIGCMIPLQAAINSQLKSHLGASTLLAALVSFAVGTLALAILAATTERVQNLAGVVNASPWHLAGGLLGAVFVFGTTLLAPNIGLARMTALVVAGQVIVSMLIDHQGWLGLAVREITATRIAGGAMVVGGVLLVNFDQLFKG